MKATPFLPVALAALVLCASLHAKVWTLSDSALEVRLDDQSGLLAVTQKSSGRVWQQLPAESSYKVAEVRQSGNRLDLDLKGSPDLRVTIELTPASDLALTLDAAADQPIKSLAYPGPFATPGGDWHLVLPLSEGSLIPVRESAAALGKDRTLALSL
jgi:hypothetical protein